MPESCFCPVTMVSPGEIEFTEKFLVRAACRAGNIRRDYKSSLFRLKDVSGLTSSKGPCFCSTFALNWLENPFCLLVASYLCWSVFRKTMARITILLVNLRHRYWRCSRCTISVFAAWRRTSSMPKEMLSILHWKQFLVIQTTRSATINSDCCIGQILWQEWQVCSLFLMSALYFDVCSLFWCLLILTSAPEQNYIVSITSNSA